jgi:CSLREA domain-containing protein
VATEWKRLPAWGGERSTTQMMTRTAIHPFKIVAVVGAFLLWGLVLAYASSPAQAVTTTEVNSTADTVADDGVCTLGEAISSANSNTPSGEKPGECSGTDDILIKTTGVVSLTGALPDLNSDMSIEGPGAGQFTVRRDTVDKYPIFTVGSDSSFPVVSISGITISNGSAGFGGGIYNYTGALTVTDSTISDNAAQYLGGGIFNEQGSLTIIGSTLSTNSASAGGGVANGYGGTTAIRASTINGNTATSYGGGVYSEGADFGQGPTGTTVTNSTISGNTAANAGGGIFADGGRTAVEHSTITKNTAPSGAGSGVGSFGTQNSTSVRSTIISANTNTDVDFGTTTNSFVSNGYNLIGSGNATGAFNKPGDQTGVSDPKLGALADNGGPTKTIALQPGGETQPASPAIDAIPDTNDTPSGPTPGCDDTGITTDQRGVQRPQEGIVSDVKLRCDIGAFELDATPPSVTIDQASGQDDSTSASPIHFTVVFSEPVTGFDGSDVTLSGGAGATTVNVSGGPTTYDVAVSGMSSEGAVIASIPAKVAQDFALHDNTASTSTDNTVTFIPNSLPVANADSASTNEDNPVTINVLGNDNDPDDDTLRVGSVTTPTNGSTGINGGGAEYTPAPDFNGTDSFNYTVSDGNGGEATATVTITVLPVNDDPTAANGIETMAEDAAPITIDFGALASDLETTDANLTYTASIATANAGTLGNVAGDPTKRTFDSADNFNGPVTINYSVEDRGDPDTCGAPGPNCAAPKSASGTVTVKVDPVNDAPTVAVASGGSCGTNDRSGTINLTVNDPDGLTQTGSLTLSAAPSSNDTLVPTLTFGGTGANRTLTATALSGKTGTANLTVTVSDGTDTGTVALTLKAGGNSNNTLSGTSATDILLGQNGDDTLSGLGGKDLLCGGLGNDNLSGGADEDTLSGGAGNDRLTGGTGADFFSGGTGTDRVIDFSPSQGDTKDTTIP